MFSKDISEKSEYIFEAEKFEKFLSILKNTADIKVLNIREYLDSRKH
jgi:hypothetical protein